MSGLWLLRGMAPDGVLTSIDVDPELPAGRARVRSSRRGHGPSRLRLINGMGWRCCRGSPTAATTWSFVDAGPAEYPRYLDEAVRLLRPGGVRGARRRRWTAPGPRGHERWTSRSRPSRDDERLVSALLPVADGLLCAVRR